MRLTWCGLGLHSLLSVSNLSQMMADISHEVKTIEDFICFPMKPPFQISWDQVQTSEQNIWKIDWQSQALMIEGHLWFKKKGSIYVYIAMYICMSIMLQNRGVLGMLPYFWPQHMLWELWHRMPFVAPMHHMQSALISSSDAMGGKTFRSKTLGDDDLDGFFPFRNDSKGWDPCVRGVVKCAKHWRPQ